MISIDAVFTEATHKRIYEDLAFCLEESQKSTDELKRKRYARMAILLSAFYLESVSNMLFDHFFAGFIPREKDSDAYLDQVDKHTDLPKPLRRFQAVYRYLYQNDLTLDTGGIRDIFTIRNKIIAHPAGEATTIGAEGKPGWMRVDKKTLRERVPYEKSADLPHLYADFTYENANELFGEAKAFLSKLCDLLAKKAPSEDKDFLNRSCFITSET